MLTSSACVICLFYSGSNRRLGAADEVDALLILGQWRPSSTIERGKEIEHEAKKPLCWFFSKNNKLTLYVDVDTKCSAKYTIDAKKSSLTFTFLDGPYKGRKHKAFYKIDKVHNLHVLFNAKDRSGLPMLKDFDKKKIKQNKEYTYIIFEKVKE